MPWVEVLELGERVWGVWLGSLVARWVLSFDVNSLDNYFSELPLTKQDHPTSG